MTAAEELRKEMENQCPFTKNEFIETVKKSIRTNGRYSFTLDARLTKTYSFERGEIPSKWFELISKWVTEEGLTISRFYNFYGVPEYDITL